MVTNGPARAREDWGQGWDVEKQARSKEGVTHVLFGHLFHTSLLLKLFPSLLHLVLFLLLILIAFLLHVVGTPLEFDYAIEHVNDPWYPPTGSGAAS